MLYRNDRENVIPIEYDFKMSYLLGYLSDRSEF